MLKFLTVGNQLYMGAKVRDKSIGGSELFNRFDGLLMDLKDHSPAGRAEAAGRVPLLVVVPDEVGVPPLRARRRRSRAAGRDEPPGSPRTPAQIDAWDAVTDVQRHRRTATPSADTGYVVEMRFNLTPMGYDITQPRAATSSSSTSRSTTATGSGRSPPQFSSNRVWWQEPWGNVGWYGEVAHPRRSRA